DASATPARSTRGQSSAHPPRPPATIERSVLPAPARRSFPPRLLLPVSSPYYGPHSRIRDGSLPDQSAEVQLPAAVFATSAMRGGVYIALLSPPGSALGWASVTARDGFLDLAAALRRRQPFIAFDIGNLVRELVVLDLLSEPARIVAGM